MPPIPRLLPPCPLFEALDAARAALGWEVAVLQESGPRWLFHRGVQGAQQAPSCWLTPEHVLLAADPAFRSAAWRLLEAVGPRDPEDDRRFLIAMPGLGHLSRLHPGAPDDIHRRTWLAGYVPLSGTSETPTDHRRALADWAAAPDAPDLIDPRTAHGRAAAAAVSPALAHLVLHHEAAPIARVRLPRAHAFALLPLDGTPSFHYGAVATA